MFGLVLSGEVDRVTTLVLAQPIGLSWPNQCYARCIKRQFMGARRANPKLGALTLGQDIGRAGLLLNSKPLHHRTGMEKRAMVHRCTGMVKRAMIHTADDAMAMRNKLLTDCTVHA